MKRGKQFQIQSKGRTLEIAGGLDVTVEIDQDKINPGFQFKVAAKEDPELTFSHRHTQSAATYGTGSSERKPKIC